MSNLSVWANTLRVTNMPQIQGKLGETEGGKIIGQCCLGVLSDCAGIIPVITEEGVQYDGQEGLPPTAAIKWLGLDYDERDEPGDGWVLKVDWPDDLRVRDPLGDKHAGALFIAAGCTEDYAALNDELGLTFPQIADIADYFGAKV